MNKKIIIAISTGCLILFLCSCCLVSFFSYNLYKKRNDENLRINQQVSAKITPTNTSETTPTAQPLLNGYTKFYSVRYGYEFQYPKNWIKDEGIQNTDVLVKSPKDGINDTFQENINVSVQDFSSAKLTLEDYTKLSLNEIKKSPAVSEILSESKGKLGNNDAYIVSYSGFSGTVALVWKQAWAIYENQLFLITYISTQDDYSKSEIAIDNAIKTFYIN